MQEKLKILAQMLFECEQENRYLRKEIESRDKIIDELNAEIFFSDLELKEVSEILERSIDVHYIHLLQDKIRKLSQTIDDLRYEITL